MTFVSDALRICISLNLDASEKVLNAMRVIDRGTFMLPEYQDKSYKDEPFPILDHQTISAPHMVMMMLSEQLFEPRADMDVLEIGTGSGYNAAVMSKVFREVTSIERHHSLVEFAKDNLQHQGIDNVKIIHGDGTILDLKRKFDRIIVTAGAPHIPDNLLEMLNPKGILLIPIQSTYSQILVKVVMEEGSCQYLRKNSIHKGEVTCTDGPNVRFVPLIGDDGY